jgi:hypothetical protein
MSFSEPSQVVVVMFDWGLLNSSVPNEFNWLKKVEEMEVIEQPVSTKVLV